MLKIIVLLIFIVPTIYNFIIHRDNMINTKKKPIFGFILALFTIFASGLCYRLDNTVLGYAIVISAVLLIYIVIFFTGMRKDGFVIFMGASPILELISFDKMNSVDIKKDKSNDLDLIIKAHGSTYIQTYTIENKDMIVSNLKKFE